MWRPALTLVAPCLLAAVGLGAGQPNPAANSLDKQEKDDLLMDVFVMWIGDSTTSAKIVARIIRDDDDAFWPYLTPSSVALDPPPNDVDDESQGMESILDEIDETLVIASTARPGRRAIPRARLWDVLRSPFAVASAATPQLTSGKPRLHMLITSLGVPTGEAFSVQFLNEGPAVEFVRGALVLQPLKKDAAARAMQAFGRATGKPTTVKMAGYCLQFRKAPPKAGMVFAVAPRLLQQTYTPAHDVFRAGRLLKDTKFLQPQGDPAAYYHSLRQWSWWTREQKFTQATFTTAFVDFTRKNVAAGGRPWTGQIEAYVRSTAPKRWSDITKVLLLADRIGELRAASGVGPRD